MTEHYVYGLHAVKALLSNPYRNIKKLYISKDRIDDKIIALQKLAESRQVAIDYLPTKVLNQRFAEFNHQGVIATAGPLPDFSDHDLTALIEASKKPALILVLDGVTDPHNLGACLRTADAAGVDFVIIPKDKNANVTPVVSKVACGAAEALPLVRVTNLVRAMEHIKQQGVWIYGAAGEASQSIYQLDCTSSMALVMGAEGDGLRRLTREHCDGLFALPMSGSVESLNVSVAAGIALYEVVRQRLRS